MSFFHRCSSLKHVGGIPCGERRLVHFHPDSESSRKRTPFEDYDGKQRLRVANVRCHHVLFYDPLAP